MIPDNNKIIQKISSKINQIKEELNNKNRTISNNSKKLSNIQNLLNKKTIECSNIQKKLNSLTEQTNFNKNLIIANFTKKLTFRNTEILGLKNDLQTLQQESSKKKNEITRLETALKQYNTVLNSLIQKQIQSNQLQKQNPSNSTNQPNQILQSIPTNQITQTNPSNNSNKSNQTNNLSNNNTKNLKTIPNSNSINNEISNIIKNNYTIGRLLGLLSNPKITKEIFIDILNFTIPKKNNGTNNTNSIYYDLLKYISNNVDYIYNNKATILSIVNSIITADIINQHSNFNANDKVYWYSPNQNILKKGTIIGKNSTRSNTKFFIKDVKGMNGYSYNTVQSSVSAATLIKIE
jgi:hypothetical protein